MLDQIDFVSENWEWFIYTYIFNVCIYKYLIVDFSFMFLFWKTIFLMFTHYNYKLKT